MKTSEQTADLFKAFVAAQAELKNAAFDKINPHFKSKYATLAGMRDGVVQVLSKHGLAVIQGTSCEGEISAVDTRLVHTSGQWIESRYPFQLDKPQQMGSAVTYARRYSLAAICGIASEEDDDANAAQETHSKPALVTKAIARPEYAKISAGIKTIRETGTIEDLRKWYKTHALLIDSFDESWRDEINKEFDDASAALKAKAA